MKKTFSKCTVAITTAALNLAFVVPSFAGVIPPTSTYAGKTLYQWSAKSWQTFFKAPHQGNPLSSEDPDGIALEAINDPSSPVFFLTGILSTVGGSPKRSVKIPENQAIFFPLVNAFNVQTDKVNETAQSLCGQIIGSNPTSLFATLDGVNIGGDLFSQGQSCKTQTNQNGNVDYGPFFVDAPRNPISELQAFAMMFGINDLPTENNLTVSDGYWLMLTPLTPGEHTLTFGGESSGNIQNNTYEITIVPVPEPNFIFSLVSLGTLGAASTLKRKLKPSKSSEKETTKVG